AGVGGAQLEAAARGVGLDGVDELAAHDLTRVMLGRAATTYSWTSVMPSCGSSNSAETTCAASASWSSKRRTPRPLPPWLCLMTKGAGMERAASTTLAR